MLSKKNDYDNFEHLKLSIEKPRGQLLCYVQYGINDVLSWIYIINNIELVEVYNEG